MTTQKNFKPNSRNISYINRDFSDYKKSLIDFSKYYFPNTNKDFGQGSVGLLYIEQMAYVGDVTAFYSDTHFQESLLTMAAQRKNIVNRAKSEGYKIRPTTPSQVKLDVYQLIPSINVNGNMTPDYKYCQSIKEGMTLSTSSGIQFITIEPLDFSVNTASSPTEVTSYQRDQNGLVQNYILKKQVSAISATRKTKSVLVGSSVPFYKIVLEEQDVISIETIIDSDNNKWYEVEHLGDDTVPVSIKNNPYSNQTSTDDSQYVPYILKYLRTSNKFTTSVDENNITTITFGSGTDELFDEEIIPSPSNIASYSNVSYINSNNLLRNASYGKAPRNTTLVITYLCGGGVQSNVQSNSIINVNYIEFDEDLTDVNPDETTIIQSVRNSIRVNNPEPAVGGDGPESDESIRQNAIASKSAQNRAITAEDYRLRVYSMPPKFGTIPKTYVEKSKNKGKSDVDVYVLSYDSNKNLCAPTQTLIKNIKTYLNQYRGVTDDVNILTGNIINIGINFKITTTNGYSRKEVLSNSIQTVKDFFSIDNFQFNQSINISQLELEIAKVDGVESVSEVTVTNLTNKNGNYSVCEYDIKNATRNNIIYPSLDPSIFEVKYPSKDIKGFCI
jgi:phage-related baseplate assembly protein